MRFDFSCRDLPLAFSIEIARSVQVLALPPISQYRPRDVSPQHGVIARFRRRAPVRLAADCTRNDALLRQHVNLDAKPNIVQQQQKRALIQYAAAHCDLGELTLATLGKFVAPGAVIAVETDQPRTRIDIQFLRYSGAKPKNSPTRREVHQLPFANVDIDCYEVADVLMDMLLHSVATIDTGTDLAEHLIPGAPDLRIQIAAQRSQVLVEATIAIARSHAEACGSIEIVTEPGGERTPSFPRRGRSTITLYMSSRMDVSG
jgi:hypothetical protein